MPTITLTQSYELHDKTFNEIKLREPKYKDIVAVGGEVWETQVVNGHPVLITHYDRLDAYVSRLVSEPPPEALAELNLADSLLLENKIGGFFTAARRLIKPPTSSSGAPENKSETSAN